MTPSVAFDAPGSPTSATSSEVFVIDESAMEDTSDSPEETDTAAITELQDRAVSSDSRGHTNSRPFLEKRRSARPGGLRKFSSTKSATDSVSSGGQSTRSLRSLASSVAARVSFRTMPDVSVRRIGGEATGSNAAREKVRLFFEQSAFQEVFDIPSFNRKELLTGRFLGRGGFSDVEEIRQFVFDDGLRAQLRRTDSMAMDDKESRLFIAEHCIRPSGDARYAIKKLRQDIVTNKDKKRFWAGVVDLAIETRFLSSIEHPNIIKLRATSDSDPYSAEYFLVLDRLYDTLQTRLLQWRKVNNKTKSIVGRLTDRQGEKRKDLLGKRLAAAYDLSAAIEYLHEKRIIHRDIKPENIGFDIRGDIKIFDFGMARELLEQDARKDGTYLLSHMTGSLRYMAPEVALGRPYNAACDVYSFSIVFWQMLALERPYNNFKNENLLKARVFEGGARPPLKLTWSKTLKSLLDNGWSADIHGRSKIGDVKDALRKELIFLRHGDDSGLDHTHRRSTYVYQPSRKSNVFSR